MPKRKKKVDDRKPSPRSIARGIVWNRLSSLSQGDIPELDSMTTMQAYRVKRQLFATVSRIVGKFGYQFEAELRTPLKRHRRQRVGKLRQAKEVIQPAAITPAVVVAPVEKKKRGPKPGFKRKQEGLTVAKAPPVKSSLQPPKKRKYTRRAGRLVFPPQPEVQAPKAKAPAAKFKVIQGKSIPALPASQIQKGMEISLGMGVHATVLDVKSAGSEVVILRLRDSATNHEFQVKQLSKSLIPASFPAKKAS